MTKDIVYSADQEHAMQGVMNWLDNKRGPQILHLFGSAGTGKTTIAKGVAEMVKGDVHYMTFTGKAALVLRGKGCYGATTIHSSIYRPVEGGGGDMSWELRDDSIVSGVRLTVVDEVSMVDEYVGSDVCALARRILVLGDMKQLPPIEGQGYFNTDHPEFELKEIHRQAKDSPIIQIAYDLIEGRGFRLGTYGDSRIVKDSRLSTDQFDQMMLEHDQILCGRNKTRQSLNRRYRRINGLVGAQADFLPVVGDKLICLKNNHKKGLLNGSLWEVIRFHERDMGSVLTMEVQSLDEPERVPVEIAVPYNFFDGTENELDRYVRANHDQFTYGYAITVHKAQGSQFDKVLLVDESKAFRREDADHSINHAYTGVTRAAKSITVVI